ncbi:MAG: hypothetical protein L3J05_05955 [Robiginitomaculum sp.]|nr:hypothetical protein [Robiginitomaculum sp.]
MSIPHSTNFAEGLTKDMAIRDWLLGILNPLEHFNPPIEIHVHASSDTSTASIVNMSHISKCFGQ